jgi:putative endonuclease
MATRKSELGRAGEDKCVAYLQSLGYLILQQNFRSGRGEIDIIALDGDELVIAEVKSVRSQAFGGGEARVDRRKQAKLIETTWGFLARFPEYEGKPLRFDVLVVDFGQYPAAIRHYRAAFWQE